MIPLVLVATIYTRALAPIMMGLIFLFKLGRLSKKTNKRNTSNKGESDTLMKISQLKSISNILRVVYMALLALLWALLSRLNLGILQFFSVIAGLLVLADLLTRLYILYLRSADAGANIEKDSP